MVSNLWMTWSLKSVLHRNNIITAYVNSTCRPICLMNINEVNTFAYMKGMMSHGPYFISSLVDTKKKIPLKTTLCF